MKAKVLGWLIAMIMRAVGLTLRWRVKDCSGVMTTPFKGSLIIAVWHNQIFGATLFYGKFLGDRRATVLTSPSRDGDLLTAVMGQLGNDAIRGSSNKRPIAALREIVSFLRLRAGRDIVITPDGPRGPVYKLQAGLIKVSQWTEGSRLLSQFDFDVEPRPAGERHDGRKRTPILASRYGS